MKDTIRHARDDAREVVPVRYSSKWDRATHIAAEYKWIISFAVALAVLAGPALGWINLTPPDYVTETAQAGLILAIPVMIFAKWLIRKIKYRDWLTVEENRPWDDSKEIWRVPPGTWNDRNRGEFPAIRYEHGNVDYEVIKFDWKADVGELYVEGVNPELTTPSEITSGQTRLEWVFETAQHIVSAYNDLKAQRKIDKIAIQGENLNELAQAIEHGMMLNDGTGDDVIDDIDPDHRPSADNYDPDGDGQTRTDERQPSLSELETRRAPNVATGGGDAGGAPGGEQ